MGCLGGVESMQVSGQGFLQVGAHAKTVHAGLQVSLML